MSPSPLTDTSGKSASIAFASIIALLAIAALLPKAEEKAGAASPKPDERTEKALGRDAEVPEDIPVRGLKSVLWRVVDKIGRDRVMLVAAGVTFYLLLALFPALAAFVSLYGFVADPATATDHIRSLAAILPPGAFELIAEQMNSLAASRASTLSLTFAVSLVIALWSAHSGTMAIFDVMNIAYEEQEKRNLLKLNLVALAFTLFILIAAILLFSLLALLPTILSFLWIAQWKENVVLALRWPILLLLALAGSAAVYRFAPSREPARFRWLTWGAAITTMAWCLMSLGFSFYLENFANYGATYGALGALMGFLIWTWLSVIILIVGAEINAELEHQTARDTTTGPERPMGSRGAYMADTIGDPGP